MNQSVRRFAKRSLSVRSLDRIRLFKNALRVLHWRLVKLCGDDRLPQAVTEPDLHPLFQDVCARFRTVVQPFIGECDWPLREVYNGFFEAVDAEFYYCLCRTLRPRMIIEIGSGYATRFAMRALRRNRTGELICIDPEPRRLLPSVVSHIPCKVEQVDLRMFDQLAAHDILFIDSSHTSEEALYHTSELLPRLKPGVLIHHHDIMYPYRPVFEEERVVLDHYRDHQRSFRILAGLAFVHHKCPDTCRFLVPSFRLNTARVPASLWVRKEAR